MRVPGVFVISNGCRSVHKHNNSRIGGPPSRESLLGCDLVLGASAIGAVEREVSFDGGNVREAGNGRNNAKILIRYRRAFCMGL